MSTLSCPKCRSPMIAKTGRNGDYFVCSKNGCKGKREAPGAASTAALAKPGVEVAKPPPAPKPLGPYPGCGPLPASMIQPAPFQLDAYQQAAAGWRKGIAVVPAAAGAGKSATLVERTLDLLREGEVPESILLLVYNADAADVLRERLCARAGKGAQRVNVYTFHAWCYACLRLWYPQQRRLWHGRILGTPGGLHPLKLAVPLLEELRKSPEHAGFDLEWGPALRSNERIAEALIDLDTRETALRQIAVSLGWAEDAAQVASADVARAEPIYVFAKAWKARKLREEYIEFCDMLAEVAGAIYRAPDALSYMRTVYRHVMVDEAQDTSLARAVIAEHLGDATESSIWVGDSRQGVYLFAGARPDILLKRAERATMLPLPVNRRSTKRIVEAGNEIARGYAWHLGGDALAKPDAIDGEAVQVWETESPREEAAAIIADIRARTSQGYPLGRENFVCLARTNAMLVDLEYAFVAAQLPCRVAGNAGGVWGTSIGEELITYLEAIEGVATWKLFSVMNKPKRYCTRADLEAVIQAAKNAEGVAAPEAGTQAATARTARTLHGRMQTSPNRGVQRFGKDLASVAHEPWGVKVRQAAVWLGMEDEDDEELEGGQDDRKAALECLCEIATRLGSLVGLYAHRKEQAKGESGESVLLSTIHKCVAPETLVEVDGALLRMDEIPASGQISTALGVFPYGSPVQYVDRPMLRITTRRGYTLTVTRDHGLYTWDGAAYARREAQAIAPGDFLRFYIGAQQDTGSLPALPEPTLGDAREVRYAVCSQLTEEAAEFLGLVVADGTVYRGGFRLGKRHADVRDRFAALVVRLLGCPIARYSAPDGSCHYAEVSSTFLARWLLSIDGTAPNAKAIPAVVRRAPRIVQAAFLRGLFEDGTVNVKGDRVDHVAWSTKYEDMAVTVQVMLLRLGMVSTRMRVRRPNGDTHVSWRVSLFGQDAQRFRDSVGFISAFKQDRLNRGTYSAESQQNAIPVRKGDRRLYGHKSARQNASNAGYLSRDTVKSIGGFEEELAFYHDRVKTIEEVNGSALCVAVPKVGRFLQNGCDGANSKGQQYPVVYVCGVRVNKLPHKKCEHIEEERRILYVAVTRAQWVCILSTGGKPSKFLKELGWVKEDEEDERDGADRRNRHLQREDEDEQ